MIKYLLTEDSIFFPEIKYTLSKDSVYFEEVLEVCKNKNSSLDQIEFISPNLTYDSDDISIEHIGNKAEIYYHGKYYEFPPNFLDTCIKLFRNRTSVTRESIAAFLLKCFKNPYYSFKELFPTLESVEFNFLDDGNILVYTEYNLGDENLKNKNFEEKLVSIVKNVNTPYSKMQLKYTIIEVNPSEIEDLKILSFKIRDVTNNKYLLNSYQKYLLFDIIYDTCINSPEEKVIERINDLLSFNTSHILNEYTIETLKEFIGKPDNLINYNLFIQTALRLCQE